MDKGVVELHRSGLKLNGRRPVPFSYSQGKFQAEENIDSIKCKKSNNSYHSIRAYDLRIVGCSCKASFTLVRRVAGSIRTV